MSLTSKKTVELKLFGAYNRSDFSLCDEQTIFTHTGLRHHFHFRSKYDSPGMRRLLLDVDRVVEADGFDVLKHDATTTVGVTSRDGRKLVIKRYNTKNNWHFLRRALRRSRAQNCFEFALELLKIGVATTPPVAYIEARMGPLKGRSWYISEFVDGPLCLDYINHVASPKETAEIAARLERSFMKLAKEKITHGDMKATNYILRNNREPVLLDLDSMIRHSSDTRYKAAHLKDRKRFMKNWQLRPDITACFSRVEW